MRLTLICRVIDNYGDAGFSLRLALALARLGHQVQMLCDQVETVNKLAGASLPAGLDLTEIKMVTSLKDKLEPTDGVIECFGSSEEVDSPISNQTIRELLGQRPWVVVDYLTAERWVESVHGLTSVDPRSGYKSVYLYPGFTDKTGGLIHHDCPEVKTQPARPTGERSIFIFSYPHAPIHMLSQSLKDQEHLVISDLSRFDQLKFTHTRQPAVPLTEFDELLQKYDWCFVRGEDSFVRAQLAGKPLVWQIYPTPDQAHEIKLLAFFNLYAQGLPVEAKDALLLLWRTWNGLEDADRLQEAWYALRPHFPALQTHAHAWAQRLRGGPELVSVILTTLGDTPLYF